jgi:hypothetical protein
MAVTLAPFARIYGAFCVGSLVSTGLAGFILGEAAVPSSPDWSAGSPGRAAATRAPGVSALRGLAFLRRGARSQRLAAGDLPIGSEPVEGFARIPNHSGVSPVQG